MSFWRSKEYGPSVRRQLQDCQNGDEAQALMGKFVASHDGASADTINNKWGKTVFAIIKHGGPLR